MPHLSSRAIAALLAVAWAAGVAASEPVPLPAPLLEPPFSPGSPAFPLAAPGPAAGALLVRPLPGAAALQLRAALSATRTGAFADASPLLWMPEGTLPAGLQGGGSVLRRSLEAAVGAAGEGGAVRLWAAVERAAVQGSVVEAMEGPYGAWEGSRLWEGEGEGVQVGWLWERAAAPAWSVGAEAAAGDARWSGPLWQSVTQRSPGVTVRHLATGLAAGQESGAHALVRVRRRWHGGSAVAGLGWARRRGQGWFAAQPGRVEVAADGAVQSQPGSRLQSDAVQADWEGAVVPVEVRFRVAGAMVAVVGAEAWWGRAEQAVEDRMAAVVDGTPVGDVQVAARASRGPSRGWRWQAGVLLREGPALWRLEAGSDGRVRLWLEVTA